MKASVCIIVCFIFISTLFGCKNGSLDIHFTPSPPEPHDANDSSCESSSSLPIVEDVTENNTTTEDAIYEVEPDALQIKRIDFDIDHSVYGYEIVDYFYSETKMEGRERLIDVHYPQVKNLTDIDKEDAINRLLWTGALRGDEEVFLHSHDDAMTHYLKIVYNVTYAGESMISVLYRGLGASSQSASSTFLAYGITIDIEEARVVAFSEVSIIDESILEKVRTGDYSAYCEHPWDSMFYDERLNIFGNIENIESSSNSNDESRISLLYASFDEIYSYFEATFIKPDVIDLRDFYIRENSIGFITQTFTAKSDYFIIEVSLDE